MQGRSFSRKFKVEAVRLVRDAQAHPGAGARVLELGAGGRNPSHPMRGVRRQPLPSHGRRQL
jgi:hypothetical protein